jgi:hypothetical protein
VVDILAKNPAKTIIKIERNEEKLIQAFKASQIGQKVYFSNQSHMEKTFNHHIDVQFGQWP